ncbi:hypothetical protein LEN26_001767 [Aphanomyces euteiches]|nr:hypothetical protein AeMF1_003417 [Aphanomyces euteiches]KAH9160621.1 hypothetical protein LEN26_001767 [Aphanomyces euteiches]KAH9194158.1 hypothetical protein AeNC1_003869 [Aphanomyces euteiches]
MDDRRSMWSSPVLRQLILGCYDTTSTLSCLRGHRELMQLVVAKIIQAWEAHIDQRAGGLMQLGPCMYGSYGLPKELQGTSPKRAIFPAPWNEEESFHVNMMPFIMGDMSSLPPSCQRYSSMIQACLETNSGDEIGRVGYLTIYEGVVEAGACQGPSGLRVELVSGGHCGCTKDSQMRALGFEPYRIYGGTYMASNAILSCRVYNSMIKNAHEVAGHLGDVEHLRWILDKHGEKRYLHHELFWIPAGIPYESVPLQMTQHRQYFRLVTSSLTHWNADHSTPNPLGIQPAAQIVHGEQI